MITKKCRNKSCGIQYKEGQDGFELERCKICGAPLLEVEIIIEDASDRQEESNYNHESVHNNISKLYYLDDNQYIHFNKINEIYLKDEVKDTYTGPRFIIYEKGRIIQIVPVIYDEIVIGRKCVDSDPEIDLSDIDKERHSSRKHCLVYKLRGEYYIRNTSSKNSVHINTIAVLENEDKKIEESDFIILSRKFALEFRL